MNECKIRIFSIVWDLDVDDGADDGVVLPDDVEVSVDKLFPYQDIYDYLSETYGFLVLSCDAAVYVKSEEQGKVIEFVLDVPACSVLGA